MDTRPFSVQAEYNRVSDERNGQGLGDVDLPNVIAQGWHLGNLALTGEAKAGAASSHPPLPVRGAGAFEVVARIEEMRFSSAETGRAGVHESAAANIKPNRDRGADARRQLAAERFGRIAFNAVRETIQDPLRSPLPDRTTFWQHLRFQFVM